MAISPASENRCSNAPPRDYVHKAGALSRRVIMRGAIIYDDDDEERAGMGREGGGGERGLLVREMEGEGIMNEKDGRSFPYRRALTDT